MVDSKNSPIYYIITHPNDASKHYIRTLRKYENGKHYYLDTVMDEFRWFSESEYYYNHNKCCIKITPENAKTYLYIEDYEFYRNLMIKDLFPLDL